DVMLICNDYLKVSILLLLYEFWYRLCISIIKLFFMNGLGNKIRILRYKKGWSQEIVAQKLGISITVLSQIENDEVDLFYNLLTKISEIFNIPIFVLLSVNNTDFVIQPTELEKIEAKILEHDQYIDELKIQLENMKESH